MKMNPKQMTMRRMAEEIFYQTAKDRVITEDIKEAILKAAWMLPLFYYRWAIEGYFQLMQDGQPARKISEAIHDGLAERKYNIKAIETANLISKFI